MEIVFTKDAERIYSTVATRSDGVVIKIKSHDRPKDLPHDYAHYIVENALKLEYGFWGKVSLGVMFSGFEIVSGRQKPNALDRANAIMKKAGQRGTQAEVLVHVCIEIAEKNLDSNWIVSKKMLAESWKPPKGAKEDFTESEIKTLCANLRESKNRWQTLPVGQSIAVNWKE